jgi:hypothetical protein
MDYLLAGRLLKQVVSKDKINNKKMHSDWSIDSQLILIFLVQSCLEDHKLYS